MRSIIAMMRRIAYYHCTKSHADDWNHVLEFLGPKFVARTALVSIESFVEKVMVLGTVP